MVVSVSNTNDQDRILMRIRQGRKLDELWD